MNDSVYKQFARVWTNAMVIAAASYWMFWAVVTILANWNLWQGIVHSMPW